MSWTYDASQLSTSSLFQVRLLLGDTKQTDQQFQDEELAFMLTQRPSIYGAAAMACRALASKLSREADTVDKDLRTVLSARAKNYQTRANDYETQSSFRSGALPYAGGISISDKQTNENDMDRVKPQFNIGMEDNLLPVGPASNETPGNPDGDA